MNAKLKTPVLTPLRQELREALMLMAEKQRLDNRFAEQIEVCRSAITEFENAARKLQSAEAEEQRALVQWIEDGKQGAAPEMSPSTAADLQRHLKIARAEADHARGKITALENEKAKLSREVIELAGKIAGLKKSVIAEICVQDIAPRLRRAADEAFALEALLAVAVFQVTGQDVEMIAKLRMGNPAERRAAAEKNARELWAMLDQRLNSDASAELETKQDNSEQ